MALPGKAGVDPSGGATYTVPIAIPPGTAGMTPSLSLSYTSQRTNGLAGMGWALGELPAITRCPRTVPQDGVHGGINYDGNDRFCLDGQRLMAISGTYGADGTEYRTERESFIKIISYGSAGSGPAWFKAWTKAGQIFELGNTGDSRIEVQGSASVRVWAANKVQDTKGNYFAISYTEDNANGDYRPARIDYTGNTAAGAAPYASVRFAYESRPDVQTFYQAGAIIKVSQRLNRVQTFVGENLVLDYRLAYDISPATQRSRLTSIMLCAADGGCLPAATFSYENGGFTPGGNLAFTIPPNPLMPDDIAKGYQLLLGDWNGDGITDMLWWNTSSGSNRWYISNGAPGGNLAFTRFIDPIPLGLLVGEDVAELHFGDWNGDSITDIMWWHKRTGDNRWFISNGVVSGSLTFTSYTNLVDPNDLKYFPPEIISCDEFGNCQYTAEEFRHIALGDWNADGVTDLLCRRQKTGDNSWYISNGAHGTALAFTVYVNPIPSADAMPRVQTSDSDIVIGDWNGDGFSDLLLLNTSNGLNYWYVSNGAVGGSMSFVRTVNPIPPASINIGAEAIPGDWNGDGITDVVLWHKGSGDNRWIISKGGVSGQLSLAYYLNANPSINLRQGDAMPIGDWNGDGIPDMVWWNKPNGANHWFLTNPLTGGAPVFPGFSDPIAAANISGGDVIHVGDWNGDGITDLMWRDIRGGQMRWFLRAGGATAPDVLKSVGNGLGEGTTITYDALSKGPPFYTKDTGAVYPRIDFQGGMYVVSRVDTTNGIGGVAGTTYRYAGAKIHLRGRGFQGFRVMIMRDEQTTTEQTTITRQDWPFLGLVASSSRTLGALELSRTDNTYLADDLGGPRRFVKQTQSVSRGRDLDGSVLPTITTSFVYDAFGNATQIAVTTGDGFSKVTNNTYANDTTNWLLGRLTRATTTSVAPP